MDALEPGAEALGGFLRVDGERVVGKDERTGEGVGVGRLVSVVVVGLGNASRPGRGCLSLWVGWPEEGRVFGVARHVELKVGVRTFPGRRHFDAKREEVVVSSGPVDKFGKGRERNRQRCDDVNKGLVGVRVETNAFLRKHWRNHGIRSWAGTKQIQAWSLGESNPLSVLLAAWPFFSTSQHPSSPSSAPAVAPVSSTRLHELEAS